MEPLHILALQNIPGIGTQTVGKILSLPNISKPTNPSDLVEILNEAKSKFGKIPIPDLETATIGWNKAIEIWKKSKQNDIYIISKESSNYPKLLLQITDSPELLHVKGNIDILNKDCIAIIGTRNPTEFGFCQAKDLGEKFAKEGYVVVSGLARGIDTAAHEGALDAGGLTVAVLAHGLHTVYPKKNKQLAEKILENNGVLISEYAWNTKSNRGNFVSRNRIQSGLSLGTLVVETKIKGGTIHTVNFCKTQNRTLIVLETPNYLVDEPNFDGNTQLIRDKRADVILKFNEDIDSIKSELNNLKNKLFNSEVMSKSMQLEKNDNYDIKNQNVICTMDKFVDVQDSNQSNVSEMIEDDILKNEHVLRLCKTCNNLIKCKLVEQGFVDLCPHKLKIYKK